MSIKYTIVENPLKPNTFTLRVLQNLVVDIDTLSRNITSKTTLTEGTVRAVISALREEIINNLIQGNSVKIDNLLTLSNSLRGVLDNPNTPINTRNAELYINARISRILLDAVREEAHFSKVVTAEKSPIISTVQSMPHAILNYYMPNLPLRISGKNLKFHPNKSDEGVTCIKTDNSHYHIPYYFVAGNKRIDFTIPVNLGDIHIQVDARYANAKNLHHQVFDTEIKVMIATAFNYMVIIRSYTGNTGEATLTVNPQTGSLIYQAASDSAGVETPITKDDTYTLMSGTTSNTITIDIIDYEAYLDIIADLESPSEQVNIGDTTSG